ncbi:MAG: methylenetetrahydrofolate reductase [Buchnera aphidicola (Meitanaphis microgallis)]
MNSFNTCYYEMLNENLVDFSSKINVSFELFPPKNEMSQNNLWNVIGQLKLLNPVFFSVTCGAFLGERNCTYNIAKVVKKQTNVETVPHLTCADLTKEVLEKIAKKYWNNGFRHIIALRGDVKNCERQPKMYAVDLIKLLKGIADFDISVAAYPEVHPEACNAHVDLINLKKKIDAGANRAITQFFFSVNHFLRFRDLCVRHGITIDIIPGIFPIINFNQLCNFSKMSNVTIPNWIHHMFKGLDNNFEISKIIGASIAIDIVKILYKEGVRNFHFYTLNKAEVVISICHVLGIQHKSC